MAKGMKMAAAPKAKSGDKARSKSEVFTNIADMTGLTRKQVSMVMEAMGELIKKDLRGPGIFTVPGLMKVTVIKKPATKARQMPNPFKPGEMMTVKAKPARKIVKVRPLKALKEMV